MTQRVKEMTLEPSQVHMATISRTKALWELLEAPDAIIKERCELWERKQVRGRSFTGIRNTETLKELETMAARLSLSG